MHEEWRDVPGYEGYYQASTIGNVKRIAPGPGARIGRNLALSTHSGNGYKNISLCVGGVPKSFQVHRIVALTFLGPPPDGKPCACHKNGDPGDNRLENIYWGSEKDNASDCLAHGNRRRGAYKEGAKLSWADVDAVRGLAKAGVPLLELARSFSVGYGTIQRVVARETYRDEWR